MALNKSQTELFKCNIVLSLINMLSIIASFIMFAPNVALIMTAIFNFLLLLSELSILYSTIIFNFLNRDQQLIYPLRIAISFIGSIVSIYKIVNVYFKTLSVFEFIFILINIIGHAYVTYDYSKKYDYYEKQNKLYLDNINWFPLFFIFGAHVIAFIGLFHIDSWLLFAEILIWYIVCGLGITVGMHRLWAHKSFRAKSPLRFLLMILASMSNQGSILHWCRDHRVHHKKSDQDGDPHNINRGFFFSHCGWLFLNKNQKVKDAGKELNFDDLLRDPFIKINHKFDPFMNHFCCFIVPGLYGLWRFESSIYGFLLGMLYFGFIRWVIQLNATWCVNSVAHTFGTRPYKDIRPTESLFTSIIASGEGWHNYHHTYPYDYATSEYGFAKQYNLSKVFIDFMWYIGQAYDLKRHVHVDVVSFNTAPIGNTMAIENN